MKGKALLIQKERQQMGDSAFADIVIWAVPEPVRGSAHGFKYRLAFVVNEVCVVRYDNEAGKGDHKHIGAAELPYTFTTLRQLVIDFWDDVAQAGG